jgi:hypothetical protein
MDLHQPDRTLRTPNLPKANRTQRRSAEVLTADADTNQAGLARLIPADVVGFFAFAAAQWGGRHSLLIVILALSVAATLARTKCVLSVLAFAGWAVGVSPSAAALVGLAPAEGAFVLAAIAFVLAAVDRHEWS